MKNGSVLVFFLLGNLYSFGQEIGGFEIQDFLVEAQHPNCEMVDAYVIGPPNDSTWANLDNGVEMQGYFEFTWADGPGEDLVIEGGFNQDNYSIQLILLDGSYSAPYTTVTEDWIELGNLFWWYVDDTFCTPNYTLGERRIIALDFETDFGLAASDVVRGISIEFIESGQSELAGVYVINEPTLVNTSERWNSLDATIFPNPTLDVINIELADPVNGLIRLMDLFGKEVYATTLIYGTHTISLANLASGTYLLSVETDAGMLLERVVKQ
jgi:hypothetical protein